MLQNSAIPLDEQQDLLEQLLSEITAAGTSSHLLGNPESEASQDPVEYVIDPSPLAAKFIEDVFRNHPENKPNGLAELTPEDLGGYHYFALYGFGRYAQSISKHEMDLMRARLSNMMKDECLMVSDIELDNTPANAPIRSFYLSFNDRRKNEAFVAVATVRSGINDAILKKPAYHVLKRKDHSSWEEALEQALEELQAFMRSKTLTGISLPGLPSAKQNLVCPNWTYVRQLREKVGTMEHVCSLQKLSRTTLIKIERGDPVPPATMKRIAKVLKVAHKRLIFENIAPNVDMLRELRKTVGCTEEELLGQFGVGTMDFFYLLEETAVIPADTMRYVHHHYKKLLGPRVGIFSKLINLSKTQALIGQA